MNAPINPSHGFTGWKTETFNFVVKNAQETLNFLALGSPNGVPPMVLLDGISGQQKTAVPEPASIALLGAGLLGLAGLRRRRRSGTR